MTGAQGLTALLAEVWAVAGDRALLYDGGSFVELRLAPGDAARFRRAKDEERTAIAVGRWAYEVTPRGRKRLLLAASPREVALRAPRLARAIADRAPSLPEAPFDRDEERIAALVPAPAPRRRPGLAPEERGILAILAGAAVLGLAAGIALAALVV